ncbi:Gfo/Idh/MocA family oxidoreductase [Deinococcus caeni]|uniref:Gfo/Idh/MocA family protein n=1 Tax=Deinococcus caeni TaxID=569127 RepID=UPI00360FF512
MNPVRVAIIGCGNRGADVYARHLSAQGAVITHVVEPRPARLAEVAARHDIPLQAQFTHWDAFLAQGRVADAVVIATPDHDHVQPCLRALQIGYDVLLEKPVCLHPHELDLLLTAEAASTGTVTVCHVLRTTAFFSAVQQVAASGRLGTLIGIQHAENVAHWHYAHSYVRGNWRASPPAAPFLLAKACHDLDLLRALAGSAPGASAARAACTTSGPNTPRPARPTAASPAPSRTARRTRAASTAPATPTLGPSRSSPPEDRPSRKPCGAVRTASACTWATTTSPTIRPSLFTSGTT